MRYTQAVEKLEEMGLTFSDVQMHYIFRHPYDSFLVNLRDYDEDKYEDIIEQAKQRIRNQIDP